MLKRTTLAKSLLIAFSGTAAALSVTPAYAQTAPSELQRVEITGSSIRRTDAETASPVQVITKQEIDQSGKGTVAEYLQTLTADSQGSVPFTYGRGFAGATAAGISLRGLGANATLVLVNGRRVAPAVLADDAQRSFVDLNQIPLEAVDHIDVVKDGASAIYGSDAVAGVVNIVLRKNYVGTTAKVSYGISQEHDGSEPRIAITHGFGDLEKDGYNVLLNAEAGSKQAIYYRDRSGTVGASSLAQFGFDPNASNNNLGRLGGNGWIPIANGVRTNNSALAGIVGSVRNPLTNFYYARSDTSAGTGFTRTFAGAQTYCNNNTNLPQTNAANGCINDMWRQLGEVQPQQKTGSFFGRLTKTITPEMEAFFEVGFYRSSTEIQNTSLLPSSAINTPSGIPISNTANTVLGAAHPDNPYFGTAARLVYNPGLEIGPNETDSISNSARFTTGLKGTYASWDYDTGLSFSQSHQTDTARKRINYRVANALLNPTAANVAAATAFSPAYAALPAGTYWRIGENAYLNSQAMYNALLQDQTRSGYSREYSFDFKVSREIGQLPGGPIGIAIGTEVRREANNLPFYSGLGDFTGLSLTAYGGSRNIFAAYTEALLPVTKKIDLEAAVRYDHYTDAGNAVTPKVGAKFKLLDSLAVRGTYSFGFRAPSSTENNANSIAAFGGAIVNDNARCNAGVAASDCKNISPTFVQRGNPALENEKSRSATLGVVWDIAPKSSVAIDLWQIKRTGLPVLEDPQAAVDAGQVVRDPATAQNVNDPGAILTGFVKFVNSSSSLTRGLDVDFKQRFTLGNSLGNLTTSLTWTHLFMQRVTTQAGVVHDYAGTHGDCNITNCMGSPADRVSAAATWDLGAWRFGTNVNYRTSFDNKLEKSAAGCAIQYADGTDAPAGCKIASFTTVDFSTRYMFSKNTEVFGSIQNAFGRTPPLDPITYGAIGYNPLDYSGAIGRYFRVGVKHSF
jgi:iron complex outermembrane receptor protein